MELCSVEGCDRAARTRGWCGRHYGRWRKHGDPLGGGKDRVRQRKPDAPCSVEGCDKLALALGLCPAHYLRNLKHGDPGLGGRRSKPVCSIDGCERPHHSRGWCAHHHRRWRIYGDPLGFSTPDRRRKGHRRKDKQGYIQLYRPEHPNARSSGTISEHVVVMSELLGRPLHPEETVHHRNGVRDDNRPENLELWASAHPPGQRVRDLVEFARSIVERYGDDPSRY